jgi:hypothetical protein
MDSAAITKTWAICALVTTVVWCIVPQAAYDAVMVRSALGPYVSALVAMIVGGFYFFMLWQCMLGRGISRTWSWLLLFFALPIFSAFIYYFRAYVKIGPASAS